MAQANSPTRRYKTYQIVGLHPNTRSVFVMEAGRTYAVDELTPADVEKLLSIGWPHIKPVGTAPEPKE